MNRCFEILMKDSFIYSPAICERLSVPDYLLSGHKTSICTWICRLNPLLQVIFAQISLPHQFRKGFFLSSPFGYFWAKAACSFRKCLATFDFLLFASFSLHFKHTGKSVSSAVKANDPAHVALNVVFFRHFSLLRILHSWPTWGLCAGGSCTLAVVTHIKGDNFF